MNLTFWLPHPPKVPAIIYFFKNSLLLDDSLSFNLPQCSANFNYTISNQNYFDGSSISYSGYVGVSSAGYNDVSVVTSFLLLILVFLVFFRNSSYSFSTYFPEIVSQEQVLKHQNQITNVKSIQC